VGRPSDLRQRGRDGERAHGLTGSNFHKGRGGFTAFDAASGRRMWQHKLPSMDFGAATVANDVVFTSTYAGKIYAFDVQTGKTLWTKQAPAGINSFPAVDGDTLLVASSSRPRRSRSPAR
jgi:alcohol dehydrogenase (cytochrome c)